MVGISSSATGLHQERVQIAGVLPHRVGIQLPFLQNDTDLWYLVPADISNRPRAAATNFMLGRLRSGVTVAQAEAELTVIASRLAERYAIDRGKRPLVQSLEAIAQGPVRQTMGLSRFAFGPDFKEFYKIVGVSADFTGYWSQSPVPTVYRPIGQSGSWCTNVILRTSASPVAVAALALRVLAGMPIPTTIANVATMQSRWQAKQTRPFARMAGMMMLALLGLGLSVQGVYAVAAGTSPPEGASLRCAARWAQKRVCWPGM